MSIETEHRELKNLGERSIFVCLGSPHHLDDLRSLELPTDSVCWTIKKTAEISDIAIFYLTAPISAVVGFGLVIETPWENPKSDWKEKYFAEINNIKLFDESRFIKNREMRKLFPEWRYIHQPRQSIAVMDKIRLPFWELLNERVEN